DVVAADDVAGCAGVLKLDAVEAIAGNNVSRCGDGAADGVAGGADDVDAIVVRHSACAGGVGADVVAFHEIAGGSDVADLHAIAAIAGDDIACAGDEPADHVCRDVGSIQSGDSDAVGAVALGGGAVDAQPDVIALDEVGGGVIAGEGDAIAGISGDEIAIGGGGATDEIVVGAAGDDHAVAAVG